MAEPVVLRDCRLFVGPYALHGSIDMVSLTASKAEIASNRMGDIVECYVPGLQNVTVNAGGFWASDAVATSLEPDTILYPRINPTLEPAAWPVSICPPMAPAATPGAAGNLSYTVVGKQFTFNPINGSHGQAVKYEVSTKPSSAGGGLYRGTVVLPSASVSATTTGSAFQLGAVSATQKIVAVLHITAINGGSWVLTIESDNGAGFATPTTRATFSAATTITTLVVETNGAITDDYFRAVLTKTGGTSCTPFVSLSIANL
jgi:hypothetical protein